MTEKHLLFVCLGNICRSPSAEAVMKYKIEKEGLGDLIKCDSAGIIGIHAGEPADARMRRHATRRGYNLTSISRQVKRGVDFDHFDMIIGMDDQNITDLKKLARNETDKKKIFRMTDFCKRFDDDTVPDPYYGGDAGFELVLDLLEDACDGLIGHLLRGSDLERV